MERKRLSAWLVLSVIMILVFAGCSKPPELEKQQAQKAMESAIAAGADKYVLSDYESATKIWGEAEKEMLAKHYNEAKKAYIAAKDAFEKAALGVEEAKKVAVEKAKTALAEVDSAWTGLKEAAAKVGKDLEETTAEWKAETEALEAEINEIKESLTEDAIAAMAKIDDLKILIDKWEKVFKDLTGTPEQSMGNK